jgi:hypothetical protein
MQHQTYYHPLIHHNTNLPHLDFSVTEASILDMCEGVLGVGTALKVRIATDRDTGDIVE